MPDIAVTSSNIDLIAKLQASFIDPKQKGQLELLIPKMTDSEKAELLKLIARSHEEYEKASEAYAETIDNLGKEYKQTLNEEDKGFRKELEGIERTETSQNLKTIEAEVYTIGSPSAAKGKRSTVRSHTFRNLVFVLIFLGLLAGGGLYVLNTLS